MKKFLIIVFAVSLPFAVFAGGQTEGSTEVLPDVGVVEYIEGEVTVDNEPADFGTVVNYGAVVATEENSYCEIVFGSKNVFRIMESTVATVRISESASEIEISKGTLAALFSKLETFTSDEPFKVKTKTALAGVRGTAFFVKVENPESTYICICNGEIELAEADGKTPEPFAAGHHKAVRYQVVDGEIEVSSAPMLYHTDADMEAVAARIDETIPWDYSDSGY